MPEPEHDERPDDASAVQGRRFKLPKFFADTDAANHDNDDDTEQGATPARPKLLASAEALGATLIPAGGTSSPAAKTEDDEVRASVLRIPTQEVSREKAAKKKGLAGSSQDGADGAALADAPAILEELAVLRSNVADMSRILQELNERGLSQDKVFNTLHSELQDYKNDFLYEHLKPVVRPLLFLFDSLDQFDDELNTYERSAEQERRGGVTPAVVRANIMFFREQLVEALRICEVTPMYESDDQFNPKLHKAIDTVHVEPQFENTIQRVVKSGWYLNGRVFRPAEVVVGKYSEDQGVRV